MFALGAVILASASFAVASGEILSSPYAMVSSVIASWYGRPFVAITRNRSSPSGIIKPNAMSVLAAFNVRSSGVTHVANLQGLKATFNVSGAGASSFNLSNITAIYNYCIPANVTYGYGYLGGQCGTIALNPYDISRSGNTFTVLFGDYLPVYPVQSSGVITISGYTSYSSFGKSTREKTRIDISLSASASGDQCSVIRYGYRNRYGYSKCLVTYPSVSSAGTTVSVSRPSYGYGYSYGYVKPPRTRRIYW